MTVELIVKEIKPLKRHIKNRYIQYYVNLPKPFGEKYEKVYCLANSILIMAPSKEAVLKMLEKFPELEKMVKEGGV